jgi:hypothetical protein
MNTVIFWIACDFILVVYEARLFIWGRAGVEARPYGKSDGML